MPRYIITVAPAEECEPPGWVGGVDALFTIDAESEDWPDDVRLSELLARAAAEALPEAADAPLGACALCPAGLPAYGYLLFPGKPATLVCEPCTERVWPAQRVTRVRRHRGFGHGLAPGTDADLNCTSCRTEQMSGVTPDITEGRTL